MARLDTAIGAVATQLTMIAIIITTAATLFVHHQTVSDAAHAALALVPLTGATWAGAALPLSTAYYVCEAFGFERGIDRRFREARIFSGLYFAFITWAPADVCRR